MVYLESPTPSGDGPAAEVRTVLQENRTILPHVTVARVGDPVRFPNHDDVYHNLFSLSEGNSFNLGRYAPGGAPEHVFENEGVVRLFCDIHPEMAGLILVLDAPHFATPSADGSYRVDGVPAGTWNVVSWHPATRSDTASVTLT
ncbi:MAG: hypothetical protein MI802_15640, partial [Desulfobacterales bacterium]|nr:hypothetical protein [Desulfobacterales bacterium]